MSQLSIADLSPAAVIGGGRVGLALAVKLEQKGVQVTLGVRSDRSKQRAAELTDLPVTTPEAAARGAALIIFAVRDDDLPARITELAAEGVYGPGQLVVHTAGVDGPSLLTPAAAAGACTAACHPVQIFTEDLEATLARLPGTVWGVTGGAAGRDLVLHLDGKPMDIPESGRVRYHAALVLAANGCAALAATAADILRAGGVIDPAGLLSSLVHASVDSGLATGQAGLSGPWVRGDSRTIAMHAEALARKQGLASVYEALARLVTDRAANAGRLDPETRRRVEAALSGGDIPRERLRRLARRARGREQR